MGTPISISLLLLTLLACASCENCPPPEDIFPCICSYSHWTTDKIDVSCHGVSLQEVDDALDHVRGKTVEHVTIANAKGDRLSSVLFFNIRVKHIVIKDCDLQGLSDTVKKPGFLGLQDSLETLNVFRSFKGANQLKSLDLSHLTNLKQLDLSENNIPEVGNDWFAKGPISLTSIFLNKCGLSKLGDSAFAALTNLYTLSMWENSLSAVQRSMLPNPVKDLHDLMLDSNSLKRLPDDIFDGMPELHIVSVRKNSIRCIEADIWSSVWKQLDFIDIEENPLECDSHMQWMFSPGGPNLIMGTCDSPDTQKGVDLMKFIESNRKLL